MLFPLPENEKHEKVFLTHFIQPQRKRLRSLLVTWQAHGVAVNLVSFHARFCFKHPLRLLVPGKKKVVTVVHEPVKDMFTCPD